MVTSTHCHHEEMVRHSFALSLTCYAYFRFGNCGRKHEEVHCGCRKEELAGFPPYPQPNLPQVSLSALLSGAIAAGIGWLTALNSRQGRTKQLFITDFRA